MLLATYWVFLIPVFQAPDEDCHLDYLFSLYSKQKLFRAIDGPMVGCSHPYVRYLFDATNAQAVKIISTAQLPVGYGTKNFFQSIDANAPTEQIILQCKTNPSDVVIYPFVYYALAASWLKLLSYFNNHLTFLFFSARFLSVIFFGCGLTFSYLTMLELGLSKLKACLSLIAIAFFPMVIFVASYIQPDNLSFAVISICFYIALRWRNSATNSELISNSNGTVSNIRPYHSFIGLFQQEIKTFWLLSLIIALLFIKYQIFLCVGMSVLAMIIAKSLRLRISFQRIAVRVFVLLFPVMLFAGIQGWIIWGGHLPPLDGKHYHWHPVYNTFTNALNKGAPVLASHIVQALQAAYRCVYRIDGEAFRTFWGCFGHCTLPLIIVNPLFNGTLRSIISWITKIIILLTFASLVKVFFSLFRLTRKQRWRDALYFAFSNPVINSYLLFVLCMFGFFVIAYPSVTWQGRHWYALICALFVSTTCFAPRVFKNPKIRERIFYVLALAWLFYSVIGSFYAINCMCKRYYSAPLDVPINIQNLQKISIHAPGWFNWLEYLDRYPTFELHPNDISRRPDFNTIEIPAGTDIWVGGKAIDLNAHSLASAVLLFLDGTKMYRANYGLAFKGEQDKYRFCGFRALIPTKELSVGTHSLTMKFISADRKTLYSTDQNLKIIVK
jgi:hypothetical protein